MRILLVALVLVAGCDQGSSCKDAIEKAQNRLDLKRGEVETMIGRCELKPWTGKERACVAGAADANALIACGDGLSTRQGFAEAMKKMNEFTDEMCACTTTKCAQRVSDEMTKWSQDMAKDQQPPPHMTEEDTKRATALGEKMGSCMQKAMSAEPQVPPPVEPTPTPVSPR